MPAAQARDVLSQAWQDVTGKRPTWRALRLALSQSRFEGSWGAWHGWNNWGAVQTRFKPPCPAGTAQATDSYPTSNGQVKYEVCFRVYPTPLLGAVDFVKHIKKYRPLASAAIESGDVHKYAVALYKDRYYGGFGDTEAERIEGYEKALTIHANIIDRELGLQGPAKPARTDSKRRSPALLLTAATLGLGLLAKAA